MLTVDFSSFQKPPVEQLGGVRSTRAALLNNAQCQKLPEARCSDTQLCLHEELMAPTPALFIWPFSCVHVLHTLQEIFSSCVFSLFVSLTSAALNSSLAKSYNALKKMFILKKFLKLFLMLTPQPYYVFCLFGMHKIIFSTQTLEMYIFTKMFASLAYICI